MKTLKSNSNIKLHSLLSKNGDYEKMKEQSYKFLKKIKGDNSILQIGTCEEVLGGLDDYYKLIKEYEFLYLYFVSFIPTKEVKKDIAAGKKLGRAKDSFAAGTTYFRADFDIRKNIKREEGFEIDQSDLLECIKMLMEIFKEDELLGTYNAVVCSGNGAHFYRIGRDTKMNAETYSNAASYYLDRISKLLEKHDMSVLGPDYACTNITRLLRLPCSENWIYEKENERVNVDLLFFEDTDSPVIETFPEKAKEYLESQKKMAKPGVSALKEIRKSVIKYGAVRGLYDAANSEIDIRDLVCKYTGRTLAPNGRNFISNRDGKYTGAFAIPEENVVVHCGTPHFKDTYKVSSPFAFILSNCANNNPHSTFLWIVDNYPELRQYDSKFYFHNELKYNG